MSGLTLNVRERFTNLRKKLDQLGYMQPLSVDSLPLVESVFTDLIWTTDSFRKCKEELEKRVEVRDRLEDYLDPYKKDNGRLLTENNRLQKKILEMKVQQDESTRDLQCRIRQLEEEKEDLKTFSEQCLNKLKKYEVEAKQMVDKIVKLQEKNMQAVIHTPDGKSKQIPFRRQRMDIEFFIPRKDPTTGVSNSNSDRFGCERSQQDSESGFPRCYTEEELRILDCVTTKCQALTTQLERAHEELELNDRKIDSYTNQLQLYEEEMQRMTRELSGGRTLEALTIENEHRSRDRLIDQLNMQLDLLQQRNSELERDIIKANALNIKDGKAGNNEKRGKNDEFYSDLENQNKQLQRKIDCLLEREKGLLRELSCVQEKRTTARDSDYIPQINGQDSETDALRGHVRALEADRDYWRTEVQKQEKPQQSVIGKQQIQSHLQKAQLQQQSGKSRQKSATGSSRSGVADIDSEPISTNEVERLRRDVAKCEHKLRELVAENEQLKHRRSSPPVRDKDDRDLEIELNRTRIERDNLQNLLDKFERQVHDIQGNVKVLTRERDAIGERFEECRAEMHEMRSALLDSEQRGGSGGTGSARGWPTSAQSQALLRRLELERDEAVADLHRMTTERDSLRERLASASEIALSDKARLQQRLEDCETRCQRLVEDRDDVQDRLASVRGRLGQLEEHNRQIIERNDTLKEALDSEKSTLHDLSSQLYEIEEKLKQSESRESGLLDELDSTEKRINAIQKHSDQQTVNVKNLEAEVSRQKTILTELDREKDQMQSEVDYKSEQLGDTERQLGQKEVALEEVRQQLGSLEQQLSRIHDVSGHREQELRALVLHNDQLEADLRQQTCLSDQHRVHITRLEQDLLEASRNYQKQDSELRESRRLGTEFHEDKERVEEKLDQLQRYGSEQQQQNSEILEQYRLLSLENEKLQLTVQQQEGQMEQLQLDIEAREKILANMRDQFMASEEEMNNLQGILKQTESQAHNLAQLLESQEEVTAAHTSEKRELVCELSAMRDLCGRLEQNKDNLQRQLSSRLMELEQLRADNSELERIRATDAEELESLRAGLRNMETVVNAGRQKEYSTQMDAQQRIAELETELAAAGCLRAQVDRLSRDLARSGAHNRELETELERSRRQLTADKFQLELASQELRRAREITPSAVATPAPIIGCGSHNNPYLDETTNRETDYLSPESMAISGATSAGFITTDDTTSGQHHDEKEEEENSNNAPVEPCHHGCFHSRDCGSQLIGKCSHGCRHSPQCLAARSRFQRQKQHNQLNQQQLQQSNHGNNNNSRRRQCPQHQDNQLPPPPECNSLELVDATDASVSQRLSHSFYDSPTTVATSTTTSSSGVHTGRSLTYQSSSIATIINGNNVVMEPQGSADNSNLVSPTTATSQVNTVAKTTLSSLGSSNPVAANDDTIKVTGCEDDIEDDLDDELDGGVNEDEYDGEL